MEAFEIVFNPPGVPTIFPSTGITGYIQPAAIPPPSSDLISGGDVAFWDIGAFIDPNNNFSQCTGGPDGHADAAFINVAITHEWIVTPDNGAAFDYNISVFPGPNLDNIPYAAMGAPCNLPYQQAKYLARNGRIGGNGSVGPTTNAWIPGVNGLYQAPTGNTIGNQNGFSRFRLFGATDDNTTLPVELTILKAEAIDNEFIKVSWSTASENNNKGFIVMRSTNGIHFDSIGWVNGHGTTASLHNYFDDDHAVNAGVLYYYRLKQIDYNGRYNFSRIVTARLQPSGPEEAIQLFPNPATANTTLQILSSSDKEFKMDTYNALGQNMFSCMLRVKAKVLSHLEIPTGSWARGAYFINLYSSDDRELKGIRFIKE
jgi:hypothetical protein